MKKTSIEVGARESFQMQIISKLDAIFVPLQIRIWPDMGPISRKTKLILKLTTVKD